MNGPLVPQAGTRRQSGFALILALLVVAFAAGAIGLAAAATSRTQNAGSSIMSTRTLECAIGGTARGKEAVMNAFRAGDSIDDVIADSNTNGTIAGANLNPGTVNVTFFDNDDGDSDITTDSDNRSRIRATCALERATTTVEVEGEGTFGSAFSGAACGCSSVDFVGTVGTDSYDSLAGPYNPLNPGSMGTVQSNGDLALAGTVDGDVIAQGDVTGSGTVTGSVFAGGTVNTANITVAGSVFQNMSPPPAPCRCNNGIDIGQMVTDTAATNDNLSAGTCGAFISGTSFDIGGGSSCVLPGGTYYFTEFRIRGSASVIIDPLLDPADDSQKVVIVLTGAGPFDMGGTGVVNSTTHALNLEIYSDSVEDIGVHGNVAFAGVLYAPNAGQIIQGNVDIYGGLFGNVISNGGTADLHFDENLLYRQDFLDNWRRRPGTWRIVNG